MDVSKGTLDYTWLPDGDQHKQVNNTAAGIKKSIRNIMMLSPEIVVVEVTGGYQAPLVNALHESSIPVKVVNPRQVRDFARSLNRLGKTDKLDALTLAEFGLSRKLQADNPKTPQQILLSAVLRRREQLNEMLIAERNHLEHAPGKYAEQIVSHIKMLNKELYALEKDLAEIISSDKSLLEDNCIIQSIPGIGPVVAGTIIAELPELGNVTRKEAAALVGVAPFNKDSGKFRGRRHIWAGRAKTRKVLYSAMRPCLRYNGVIRGWFDRFRAAGKLYKVAVIACIRKILTVIRAMLISRKSWNPHYFTVIPGSA